MRTRIITAFLALLVVSCGSNEKDPGPNTNNGVDADAGDNNQISDDTGSADSSSGPPTSLCGSQQALVILDEMIRDLVADADWSFTHSSDQGRAYALNLPGTDGANIGEALAFMPCTEAAEFDPYCEPDDTTGLSRCLRIGCESATIAFAEVYFTDGSTQDPTAEIPISYDIEGGSVEFRVRPLRRWRNDMGAAVKTITSDFVADFTVHGADTSHRFSYAAAVSVTDENATVGTFLLEFDELAGLGAATLDITHGATFSGTLTVGAASVEIDEAGVDWATCSE